FPRAPYCVTLTIGPTLRDRAAGRQSQTTDRAHKKRDSNIMEGSNGMARKALLVGINEYQSFKGLKGCINNITNFRENLKSFFGCRNEEVRLLANARATKDNILARLNWLVRGAKAGDLLVFQFSGHGSQVRDRDGDELSDHLDEILCPSDMNWDGNCITDDDL